MADELFISFQHEMARHHWLSKKLLIAVSGGVDSMVLAALCHRLKMPIHLAHCNFGLRGEESDGDEQMLRTWAKEEHIPLSVKHFDTPKILKEKGGNLQDTARSLRYEWFEELRKKLGFDFIAVAHHQQDSVETLLMNFFRGTGIAGMHGILPQQGRIIRPVLTFSKAALQDFAQAHHIPWREDSSNAKDNYLRNRIRHQLLPQISEIFPQAIAAMQGNMERMREVETLYRESIAKYRTKLLEKRHEEWYLSLLQLKSCPAASTLLFELLHPFGFHAAQMPDIIRLCEAPSGKWVGNERYKVVKNRGFLIITSSKSAESTLIQVEGAGRITFPGGQFRLQKAAKQSDWESHVRDTGCECISLEDADFPLILRPLRDGDYFYPIGMGRKKKKVGKFLRDLKVPLHEKEKVWVLESKKRIIWVLGYRIDERFKIEKTVKDPWLVSWKKDI